MKSEITKAADAEAGAKKPKYVKPEVVASYSERDLEEELSEAYGQTHVDLFGPDD